VPSIAAYTDDGGARLGAMWSWIHDYYLDEPHWYLDHVAVAPERQVHAMRSRSVGSVESPKEGA